jgi:REP element-mobilizing transposase RayT
MVENSLVSPLRRTGVQLNALIRQTTFYTDDHAAAPLYSLDGASPIADDSSLAILHRTGIQLNALIRQTTFQIAEHAHVPVNNPPTHHSNSAYRRRSIRLRNYDYSQSGAYFLTICTHNRVTYFDDPSIREIASDCWLQIPTHFANAELDEWVLMPNHLHGILVLENAEGVQLNAPRPTRRILGNRFSQISPQSKALGVVIRTYKAAVTTRCRAEGLDFVWQRNYYEHMIRSQNDLDRAREYIFWNPSKWDSDELNPKSSGKLPAVGTFK